MVRNVDRFFPVSASAHSPARSIIKNWDSQVVGILGTNHQYRDSQVLRLVVNQTQPAHRYVLEEETCLRKKMDNSKNNTILKEQA